MNTLTKKPLTSLLSLTGLISGGVYYQQSKTLKTLYPDIPIKDVPATSYVRGIYEKGLNDFLIDNQGNKYWTPYYDCFQTKIPLEELRLTEKTSDGLSDAFVSAFLNQPILKAEGKLLGDSDDSKKIEVGDVKLSGVLSVHALMKGGKLVTSNDANKNNDKIKNLPLKSHYRWFGLRGLRASSVLFEWKMPTEPIGFFDKIATYGYPYRLMSGGYQELHTEIVKEDGKDFAIFTYATTHTYNRQPHNKENNDDKVIPKWTQGLHDSYARFLLNGAINTLKN